MKSIIIAIITASILSFVVTENYILSHMKISSTETGYTVTVFGADFEYK